MKNLQNKIENIYAEADRNAVEAIIGRAEEINSMLDDAYGSMLAGYCAAAMECAAEAVAAYEELIELAETATDVIIRAALLDAFGTVKLNKFELPVGVEIALKERARNARKEMIK